MKYQLKYLAEAGYIMGLETIGDVATHMELHHHAYFITEKFHEEMRDFEYMVAGHENESIDKYLTEEDRQRMDAELEKTMADKPHGGPIS